MNSGICIIGKPEINGCILCNLGQLYQVVSTFNQSDYIENKNAFVFRSFEERTVHVWIPSNLNTQAELFVICSVTLVLRHVLLKTIITNLLVTQQTNGTNRWR